MQSVAERRRELQVAAVCCSVLQCATLRCSVLPQLTLSSGQRVAVCFALQCVATTHLVIRPTGCSVLKSVLQSVVEHYSVVECAAVCGIVV